MTDRITITCPNCGHSHQREVKVILGKPPERAMRQSSGRWLQSIKPSFWNIVIRGKRPEVEPAPTFAPAQERIVVRSEHKTTAQQIMINEMEIPASREELAELKRVYVDLGFSWSKDATVKNTSLGGKKHDNIKDAFLKVKLLNRIDSTHYELTDDGRRFLLFVSQTESLAHYPTADLAPYLVKNWPTVSIEG